MSRTLNLAVAVIVLKSVVIVASAMSLIGMVTGCASAPPTPRQEGAPSPLHKEAGVKVQPLNLLQIVDKEGNSLILQSAVGTCAKGWRRAVHNDAQKVPMVGCYAFDASGDLVVDYDDGTRNTIPAHVLSNKPLAAGI